MGGAEGCHESATLFRSSATRIALASCSTFPKCASCSDLMVAPEASALRADGEVSYLWSCDCCGQSFVTNAANVA
jgi:hypothetical protein